MLRRISPPPPVSPDGRSGRHSGRGGGGFSTAADEVEAEAEEGWTELRSGTRHMPTKSSSSTPEETTRPTSSSHTFTTRSGARLSGGNHAVARSVSHQTGAEVRFCTLVWAGGKGEGEGEDDRTRREGIPQTFAVTYGSSEPLASRAGRSLAMYTWRRTS